MLAPARSRDDHVGVLPQGDPIANLQLLELGHDPLGAVDVETEEVLQSVVAVEAAAPLAHLDEPRPDGGGRGVDCDGAGGDERGPGHELVSGQPPAASSSSPPTGAAAAQHEDCAEAAEAA